MGRFPPEQPSIASEPVMSDVQTQSASPAVEPERRTFGRRAMFLHATAVVMGGARWPCIVVNKSETGAQLKVKDRFDFPDLFKLVIEDDNQVVHCSVIRRAEDLVGVEFVAAPRPPVDAAAPATPRVSTIRKKVITASS
jgi:PilZ domain